MSVAARAFHPATHVRAHRADQVTTRNVAAEADPRDAGLTREGVDSIWASVVRLYRTGLHPAIALCMRRRGAVVIDRAIGHLRGNAPDDAPDAPKTLARPDSLFNLYSASKAVTAMLVHSLDEKGQIHLDDPVAEYVPEFAARGKGSVTIRQVLTHRAGIPAVAGARIDLSLVCDWERILSMVCGAEPLSVPGRRLAYHALTGGYVLAEVVQRVTGKSLRVVLDETIRKPLGFRSLDYGVPKERIPDVAENAFTGLFPVPPYSWLIERALGVGIREAAAISNDPRFLAAVIPSGNVIGTADEACRFFQLLLNGGELDGVRVFDRRTVRRAIAEQSYLEVDSFLGLPVRYGMGFMLGGRWLSLYGHDTAHAFGHIGFTNVLVYADPERDVSVALMTSGKPFITPGQLFWLNVARVIARVCPKKQA